MSYDEKVLRRLYEKIRDESNNKEEYISKIIDTVIMYLINERVLIKERQQKKEEFDKEKIKEVLVYEKWLLNELYNDYLKRSGSNKSITEDLEYVGSGATSIAFKVGDNVIKWGRSYSDRIFNNKFESKEQIPIYLREFHKIGTASYLINEITPYVNTKNITHEDVRCVYKNIRKLGYIWNDPKEENVGRIIEVNGCKIGDKEYFPKYQYKEGDLVAIDLEDIAYVGEITDDIILDEIACMSDNSNVYKFEIEYMKENGQNSFGIADILKTDEDAR